MRFPLRDRGATTHLQQLRHCMALKSSVREASCVSLSVKSTLAQTTATAAKGVSYYTTSQKELNTQQK